MSMESTMGSCIVWSMLLMFWKMMMVVNSQGIDRKDNGDYKGTYVFFEELGYETCIAEQVI